MKLFWHVVEVGILVVGYLALWTVAASWISSADWFAFGAGCLLVLVLIGAAVAIGTIVYQRTKTHFTKEKSRE